MTARRKAKRCGHRSAGSLWWAGSRWNTFPQDRPGDALVCNACGAWFPLGPARDDGEHAEAVWVEQQAARVAAKWAPLDGEGPLTIDGWHWHRDGFYPDGSGPMRLAGYLAREIATHDDTNGGEP